MIRGSERKREEDEEKDIKREELREIIKKLNEGKA